MKSIKCPDSVMLEVMRALAEGRGENAAKKIIQSSNKSYRWPAINHILKLAKRRLKDLKKRGGFKIECVLYKEAHLTCANSARTQRNDVYLRDP